MALNGTFSVMYFIGPRDDNADSYILDDAFAGLAHIFTMLAAGCVNCAQQETDRSIVTNTTPITSALLDLKLAGAIPSLKAEDVEPFLIKYLKWIIVDVSTKVCSFDVTLLIPVLGGWQQARC